MQVELIPTDEGDSTGVSLLPVGVLYTVHVTDARGHDSK
jgi:hypothetical protein